MIYPKIPLAQSIIEICHAKGIQHIVIAPGSRNAPLTIGFTANPYFTCYSVADERCAAFFALGIAQQVKKPVVVICTSGSAVLNFYPAVAEAFYSQIPLVIISADRPKEKVDIGDGQTIRQENVLANHTHFNANLTEEASEENDLKINEAFNKAFSKLGPTHINAPFEEPLYETMDVSSVDTMISTFGKVYRNIPFEDIIASTNIWNTARKKLILIGTLDPNELDPTIINHLANDPSVIVMTEATSNLHHETFLNHIDAIITPFNEEEVLAFQPEIVLTFGGMIVSKRIKSLLRDYPPDNHWHVDRLRAYDTFGSLTFHFEANPSDFFHQFLPYTKYIDSNYRQFGLQLQAVRKEKHEAYFADIPFCDFKAFETIVSLLPENIQLQVGNSSSIRYLQLFDLPASIDVFCNRGTSGIDGSTSTAIGAAVANKKDTVLITGDVSFFYDSNALWNNYIPKNFKIIVINNGGGGIFRILPGHQENEMFHTYFETAHCLTAESLANMYRFQYRKASDTASLQEEMKAFLEDSNEPQILEVFTPTYENDVFLKNYFKVLK
ncbi:MAG TPA: 2-succinyl-5-enolpyruvyl-6-hydroxy-3-cyclohexene-1-carboxylic-acid synthase [Flavobacterium sp.]|jgi:2-succinyl-5-enolpyruvyl-6-hydroxy-3-cyclohexene-1-carboxylate synthase|nr:2-succinyl-5-enolpyruvyl-6-hydroxy-3-cyclohexene-1-carboxylic-acid synthase [Flavobacterium sp.]HQX04227.1 2-succinyl-5-enolpyruvyl-6-hydroxy-3-cyclohexene-1-carboxylic-acid synthase [Flavobacterium sp.]HRZ32131.1 2-succinyl-5-enolpyruvyl-6-hydroxy-3-cyclohexene-1-carboxylic-acid synthase [Flavobacterium sp.]HRZ74916.1 2-succinyl-5-enolpyruvyl-6-hydroxy-3-cyclohexene-1-carboxylic-acid synthase [Flavobacterium sp.]